MKSKIAEPWLVNAIAKGIGLLMGSKLHGAPFASNPQDVQAVCESWLVAFMTKNTDWHQAADQLRVESAFKKLVLSVRKWPAPAELFDYMANRPEPQTPKIPHKITTTPEGYEQLNKARAKVGLKPIPTLRDSPPSHDVR